MRLSFKDIIRSVRGFTLIEMSVVIMVVGVIIAGITPLYSQYVERKQILENQQDLQEISDALGAFRAHWGRYPCPSSLATPRDNVNYGREVRNADRCITVGAMAAADTAIGRCAADGGICVEQSVRDPVEYPDPHDSTGATKITEKPRVVSGFIPFRQLGLEESQAYDSYGNRIIYAVTEHMAHANSFVPTTGGIDIVGFKGNQLLGENGAGTAHFFVASLGADRAGAYTQAGERMPCDSLTSMQLENTHCNIQGAQPAVYAAEKMSSAESKRAFDDLAMYFTQDEMPLWQISLNNPVNIHQKANGAIGVFDVDRGEEMVAGLYASGTIRAQDDPDTRPKKKGGWQLPGAFSAGEAQMDEIARLPPIDPNAIDDSYEGRIQSHEVCPSLGSNDCFLTNAIAGSPDTKGGMRCPPGEYMQGIREGQPVCSNEVVVKCPVGQILIGVNPDGTLICSGDTGPTYCPVTRVDVCGESQALPRGTNGQTETLIMTAPTPETNYQATYQCNTPVWTLVSSTGQCTNCTADEETRDICPDDFDGEHIQRRIKQCPSGTWGDWETVTNSCVCANGSEERTRACPNAWETGEIRESRTRICPAGDWTDWTLISNTCACTDQTESRTIACPAPQNGTINQQRTRVCGQDWGNWIDISNNCSNTCQPGEARTIDVYFLADNTGSMGEVINAVKNKASYILGQLNGGDPRFDGANVNFAVGAYWGDPSEGGPNPASFGPEPAAGGIDIRPPEEERDSVVNVAEEQPDPDLCPPDCGGPGPGGGTDPFKYKLLQPMTSDSALAQAAINQWAPSGGGDWPEGQFNALHKLATEDITNWRSNSGHIVIWLGDAFAHEAGYPEGGTLGRQQVINALRAKDITVVGLKTLSGNVSNSIDYYGQATDIANATDGAIVDITSASDEQIAQIMLDKIYTATTCENCVPRTETRSVSCPAGQTGSITETRSSTCPGNVWGAWTVTSNTCTPTGCPVGTQEITTRSAGFAGGGRQSIPSGGNDAEVRIMGNVQWVADGPSSPNGTFKIGMQLDITVPPGVKPALSSVGGQYLFEFGDLKANLSPGGTGLDFYKADGTFIQSSPWTEQPSGGSGVDLRTFKLGGLNSGEPRVEVPYAMANFNENPLVMKSASWIAYTGNGTPLNTSMGSSTMNWTSMSSCQGTGTTTGCNGTVDADPLTNPVTGITLFNPDAGIDVSSGSPGQLNVTVNWTGLTFGAPAYDPTLDSVSMNIAIPGTPGLVINAANQGGVSHVFTPPGTHSASSAESQAGSMTFTVPWDGTPVTSVDMNGVFNGTAWSTGGANERIDMSGNFSDTISCAPPPPQSCQLTYHNGDWAPEVPTGVPAAGSICECGSAPASCWMYIGGSFYGIHVDGACTCEPIP